MARYDAAWRRPVRGGGYDRAYGSPTAPWWGEREPRSGEGTRWREERGTAVEEGWESSFGEGVFGPGRYGLGPYHERLRRRRRPDDELKQEIEEALFYDTWVDADAVTVEVRDGVVTLSGELPNYEEIRYATDDAWDVDGVVGVRSQLTVRSR